MKHPKPQLIKVGSPIGLSFDQLESMHLCLSLSITLLRRESSTNSIIVSIDSSRETAQFWDLALLYLTQPRFQHGDLPPCDHGSKILSKSVRFPQLIIMKTDWFQCPHLSDFELTRIAGIEPGRLPCGERHCALALRFPLFAVLIDFHPLRSRSFV